MLHKSPYSSFDTETKRWSNVARETLCPKIPRDLLQTTLATYITTNVFLSHTIPGRISQQWNSLTSATIHILYKSVAQRQSEKNILSVATFSKGRVNVNTGVRLCHSQIILQRILMVFFCFQFPTCLAICSLSCLSCSSYSTSSAQPSLVHFVWQSMSSWEQETMANTNSSYRHMSSLFPVSMSIQLKGGSRKITLTSTVLEAASRLASESVNKCDPIIVPSVYNTINPNTQQ